MNRIDAVETEVTGAGTAEDLESAAEIAKTWAILHRPRGQCDVFFTRVSGVRRALDRLETSIASQQAEVNDESESNSLQGVLLEVGKISRLMASTIADLNNERKRLNRLPRILGGQGGEELRVAAIAATYLGATGAEFSVRSLRRFLQAVQSYDSLNIEELWSISMLLKFCLVELTLHEAGSLISDCDLDVVPSLRVVLRSFKAVSSADWVETLEPIVSMDRVLDQDPAEMFKLMDTDSRDLYRRRISYVSWYSDCTEARVAQIALELAREGAETPASDPRIQNRRIHVGYYLLDRGFVQLASRVGFHPPFFHRIQQAIRKHNEDVYLTTVSILTVLIIAAAIFHSVPIFRTFFGLALAITALLLPASQAAVEFVNHAISALFKPEGLPKLDFSKEVPADCATLVAVPCLLLNERQVRGLVNDLEVRFLANRDPQIYFALLTDLPDSITKPNVGDSHPLVSLAGALVDDLNERYANSGDLPFILLHRYRLFNRRQGVWMGWERKRGKLLDLNCLLTGGNDAFPIKSGNIEALKKIRYVLTLDSDTQLPRGTAARLIGAMAHPLNQAVVDPKRRIVTEGYGILQPRIGIAARATARSRLAILYSGQTGLDIYSRAVSDAYQDLFGEGIYTGKGIYEVETLNAVLKGRFPKNTLLSHDLIEGAYARAGLAADVELLDDYPSHYSAYSRRKHRWLRGDWQIAQWVFSKVPDETGHPVPNPTSYIARWKIFDNLRRSMVQPLFFLLFVAGWFRLRGGPAYWTLTALVLLFLPSSAQLCFTLGRALGSSQLRELKKAVATFRRSCLVTFIDLVLLAHQMLLAVDAIARSIVRLFVSGESLLEWETAAQAESSRTKSSPVDWYLRLTPVLAIAIGSLVWIKTPQPEMLVCSIPILLLWALALPITFWLDATPQAQNSVDSADKEFLSSQALLSWRYFAQFGTERHSYLIPDNVREENFCDAPRVSPTNIGLLLNSRQAALQFGFLTAPEMADLTCKSLSSIACLKKFRGHLYNWYDTHTLVPLSGAEFISTVDSGNFAASLYSLAGGVRLIRKQPLLLISSFSSLRVYWKLLTAERKRSKEIRKFPLPSETDNIDSWIAWLPAAHALLETEVQSFADHERENWWLIETRNRLKSLLVLLQDYLPWTRAEFYGLRAIPELGLSEQSANLRLDDASEFAQSLLSRLSCNETLQTADSSLSDTSLRLRKHLEFTVKNLENLKSRLAFIEQESIRIADAMEFEFLIHPERKILSIGYDLKRQQINDSCYDMVASEARIATFLAIAKGDLPQQGWLNLSRNHVRAYGNDLLVSWTGTMFEYLMPALWMRSYPGTLIARSQENCVSVQRAFARSLRIPWGISESGSSRRNDCGDYHYEAYGIPAIALSCEVKAGPVISPYSTFLALGVEPHESIANLRRMVKAGWTGTFGLYESIDYSIDLRSPVITREWMAHHEGMSLIAVLNLLYDNMAQHWFHSNPVVQSAEFLLQERPMNEYC